jgi:6-phosphogluconolactonase
MRRPEVSLVVASNKESVASILNATIVQISHDAIKVRGVFTVALSGGSLPSFLSSMNEAFDSAGIDPMYTCWHVILADERCVPNDDPDNNLSAIRSNFLGKVSIPDCQVHGIDESKLNGPTEDIATSYENTVRAVLEFSHGYLDLAVLGFGPDGTCPLSLPKQILTLSLKKRHFSPQFRSHVLTFSGSSAAFRNVQVCSCH